MYTDTTATQRVAKGAPHAIGFTDSMGRWWAVEIWPMAVQAAKNRGIDLAATMGPHWGPFPLLAYGGHDSQARLVNLLAILLDDQATSRGMTPRDFMEMAVVPETLERASVAVFEALRIYYPPPVGLSSKR